MVDNIKVSGFELCGRYFMETVETPNGQGLVQGILRDVDGSLKVIVSHRPDQFPPETVPVSRLWRLMYYEPEAVKHSNNSNYRGK
jgi:hypothetical protein